MLLKRREIAACPFCGGSGATVEYDLDEGYLSVLCHCEAEGPPARTKEEAVSAWNRRAGISEYEQCY